VSSTAIPQTVIQVRGLTNRFGDNVVHDNLDLDVYSGEILGVVGGSGSGKSVLLRSITGLNTPTRGEITITGKQAGTAGNIGVLFQKGALFSSLTVLENTALPLIELAGLSRQQANDIARIKLALTGLPEQAGALYPSDLSGGMIKRAALARSLALEPDVLFLDEPTAGLDPIGAAAFDRLLVTLRDAFALTVFLITHDLDTLYAACDRIAVIAQKKVLVVDTLEKVASTPDDWIQEYFHGPRGRAASASNLQT